MSIQKIVLFICLFVLIGRFCYAQTNVKVQILNSQNKEAIPYASVFIKGNPEGMHSDVDGWFSLLSSTQETIIINCLGYRQRSILAFEVIDKRRIELDPDTLWIGEVTVFSKSAYKMLLQARDSTYKYQRKSMEGTCKRQDQLSLNQTIERKSDALISFEIKDLKDDHNNIEYWLESLHSESYSKLSKQPYLAYPSTIPFNLFSNKWPTEEELSQMKCMVASNHDGQLIIKIVRAKPTKNLINQATYFINKRNWIIEEIEYEGNFKSSPIKKSNRYHYQTNIQLTYDTVGDSCSLSKFHYKMIFSHKKIDPANLWEYLVNMEISTNKSESSFPHGKKLHPLDYLLFKNKNDNLNL